MPRSFEAVQFLASRVCFWKLKAFLFVSFLCTEVWLIKQLVIIDFYRLN